VLTKAVEECKAHLEAEKGRLVIKEAARAVSEKEERALEEELQVGAVPGGGNARLCASLGCLLCAGWLGRCCQLLAFLLPWCRPLRLPIGKCLATRMRMRTLRRGRTLMWMQGPRLQFELAVCGGRHCAAGIQPGMLFGNCKLKVAITPEGQTW
jgi:hypothetical protein